MKVTALGVLGELFRRPSDVSGFANFVIKSNKKQKLHVEEDEREWLQEREKEESIDIAEERY